MSNPTTPFSWQMPTNTDLVTDLPADFEVFGQAVATSMADLLGGTTGQILSKTSNTDMDFTWISAAPGDITGVTAGTGISGGGTSGDVTITNSMATAIDAKGDLIGGTGADTFSRLAVGTNGTVLTADSSTATGLSWVAPGGWTLLSTTTLSGTTTTISSINQTYRSLKALVYGLTFNTNTQDIWFGINGATSGGQQLMTIWNGSGTNYGRSANQITDGSTYLSGSSNSWVINIDNYASTAQMKIVQFNAFYNGNTISNGAFGTNSTSAVSSITMKCNETFTAGTVLLYGVK